MITRMGKGMGYRRLGAGMRMLSGKIKRRTTHSSNSKIFPLRNVHLSDHCSPAHSSILLERTMETFTTKTLLPRVMMLPSLKTWPPSGTI